MDQRLFSSPRRISEDDATRETLYRMQENAADHRLLAACGLLDLAQLGVIEQDLKTFTHQMSLNDSN